jgi:hypothetical protein
MVPKLTYGELTSALLISDFVFGQLTSTFRFSTDRLSIAPGRRRWAALWSICWVLVILSTFLENLRILVRFASLNLNYRKAVQLASV